MPKYQPHTPSHEKFLKNADDFCIYTIKMLKDEAICPKSARWLGAEEIVKIAQHLHTQLHCANSIRVTNLAEKNLRHAKQVDAYSLLVTLGEKFVFNGKIYSIDVDKMKRWLNMKAGVQSWLSAWIRSDNEIYKNLQPAHMG